MYHNPVEIVKTNDWLSVCNNFIKKLGIRNPLVITSNGNVKRLNLLSFFDSEYFGIDEKDIHFANTRKEKVHIIARLKCDWFIDDLLEVFEEHFGSFVTLYR